MRRPYRRRSVFVAWRAAWRVACGVALAAAFAVASCTPFGEGAADPGGADASAVDASVVPEAGGLDGAAIQDGGRRLCQPPLCEDFETETWKMTWPKTGDAELTVSAGASTSGVRALDLFLDEDGPTYVERLVVGPVSKIVASVSMLVVTRGAGEVDFFEVVDGQGAQAQGVHLVHAAATQTYVTELSPSSGSPGRVTPLDETFATYTRVTIELDFANHAYTLTAGGARTTGDLDPAWKPTQLAVAIGAAFTQNVSVDRPWRVRFDDAEIIVTR